MIEFTGAVTVSELQDLGRAHAENLAWAGADTFHIVADGVDLSQITHAQLDALRAHYRKLHQSIDFFMLRRSGWVCRSSQASRSVEYWLRERHSRDGQATEVFLAASIEGLGGLFAGDEIAAAASRSGFVEKLRIDHTCKHPEDRRHVRER
ncbi:MAG: hypothetical protein K2P70_04425 [Hyphomonadaceae bacterium]|nr:hypothetical protein [Hyphomonadaceae bacterium]